MRRVVLLGVPAPTFLLLGGDRSLDAGRAVRCRDGEQVRLQEAVLGEGCCDGLRYRFQLCHPDERDGRAAETAAGHPRTDRPRGVGGVDGQVDFGHRDLEVVAHRHVGSGEEIADRLGPVGTQGPDGAEHGCWFSVRM